MYDACLVWSLWTFYCFGDAQASVTVQVRGEIFFFLITSTASGESAFRFRFRAQQRAFQFLISYKQGRAWGKKRPWLKSLWIKVSESIIFTWQCLLQSHLDKESCHFVDQKRIGIWKKEILQWSLSIVASRDSWYGHY